MLRPVLEWSFSKRSVLKHEKVLKQYNFENVLETRRNFRALVRVCSFWFSSSVNRVMLAQLSFYLDKKRLICSFLLKNSIFLR